MAAADRIVFLDDNADLRFLVKALINSKMKLDCLDFATLGEMRARSGDVLTSKVAILDINLGPGEQNGLDAHKWLIENGYSGKIFFLTGHARSHPLVADAVRCGADVWEKPIQAESFCKSIGRAVSTVSNPE